MRDFVETGFDVTFHDPLIGVGREMAHLGHRVMSPAPRAEPVRAREEIRLEDRLQHQLQRCLDHPIPDRGDPQATPLAARLGDHPLTYRQRAEAAVPQLGPQLVEEHLDALARRDGGCCRAIHPGRAGTLVAPHPIPGDQQERRIGDEVEQIIEPAMRIITSPTVQFGLDLPYPTLRPKQRELRFIGVHQRPPGIPASFLPTCWPPSPCTRLSRARTTTGPPPRPHGHRSTTDLPATGPAARRGGRPGTVPTFTRNRSMREAPALTPTASPRLRRRPSAWPPHRTNKPASELIPTA